MFFEQLELLCKEKKTTPSAFITKILKLSSSKVTAWKKGSIPKYGTLEEIANYFEVSVGELFDGKKDNNIKENLSINEKELLTSFRQLSEREQLKVIGKLEILAELEVSAKTKEEKSVG